MSCVDLGPELPLHGDHARSGIRMGLLMLWTSVLGTSVLGVAGCGPAAATDTPTGAPPALAKAPAATAAATEPAADPSPESTRRRLVWTGCEISKIAYMEQAVEAYTAATGVEILVTGGGATRGIRATVGGQSDLGGTCRHALEDEFPDDEAGAVLTHVAWDALVFFANRSTTVTNLTADQARGILLGEITDWSAVGGPSGRIKPAFRRQTAEGKLSGVGYMTRLLLFDDPDVDYTEQAVFLRSSGPVEEFVEQTPGSIAVTGVSSARLRDVSVLALDGVEPTVENIASGRYPLFRPLYVVSHGPPQGEALAFLDWLTGPDGQAVLARQGTVTLAQGAGLADRFAHWPANVRNR